MEKVLILDDALTEKDCDELINESKNLMGGTLESPWNYSYFDFPIDHHITSHLGIKLVNQYSQLFPEVNFTFNKWYLENFRIKLFEPGKFYDYWHSEQGYNVPRIVAILVYLSDHKCGTEFYDGTVVESKKGRALIFPAFWTHTHRGQICPENKPRTIMSSYINLIDDK